MALPLFGQQGGVSRKQAPSLLETEHAASDAELLESARAALRDLCDGGARADGLARCRPASAEADRPTMDAAARDAHDAALRAFVFALAPFGGRFEAHWAFAVPAAKEAERASPPTRPALPALFGNACAADAAFAEDVAGHAVACAGAAADAVEALTNGAAADLPGPAPIFAFAAGSLSDDASDAAAASVIDASLRTGALEKRSLAVALTVAASKSCRARGAAGALPRAALLKVVAAPNVEAVARSLEGDAAAKVLCPQLADLAASDDGDAAFRVLETAFLGAGALHALALRSGDRSPALAAVRIVHGCAGAAAIRDLAAAPGDDAASALAALAAGPGAWDHLRLVFGHTSLVEALETAPRTARRRARTLATAAPPPDLAAAFYGGLLARADLRRRAGDASWLDLAAPALATARRRSKSRARGAPPLVLALAAGDGALIAEALAARASPATSRGASGRGPTAARGRAVDAHVGNAADAADAAAVAAPRLVDLAADDATVGEIADRCLRALAAAPGRRALAQEWGLGGSRTAATSPRASTRRPPRSASTASSASSRTSRRTRRRPPAPPPRRSGPWATRREEARAKPQTPDAAVPALVACLASADGDLRAAAAETCAQLTGSPARTAGDAAGGRAAPTAGRSAARSARRSSRTPTAPGGGGLRVHRRALRRPRRRRGARAAVAAALGDKLAWSDGALGPALRRAGRRRRRRRRAEEEEGPGHEARRQGRAQGGASDARRRSARAASFLAASFLAAKLGGGDGGDDDGAAARVCLAALGAAGAEAPAGDDYARQAWARRRRRPRASSSARSPGRRSRPCGAASPTRSARSSSRRCWRCCGGTARAAEDRASARGRRGRGPEERLAPRLGGGPAPARGRGARGDCAALLEASEAPGARGGCWPLFAAAKKLRAAAAWATLRAVLAAARGLLEGDGAHSIAAADVAGDAAFADASATTAARARAPRGPWRSSSRPTPPRRRALGAGLGRRAGSSVGARAAASPRRAAGAAPAALFDAALAPAEADDDPSLLRAVADALGSAGPAAVKALGHVARSCRPLLVAARADEAFDGAESGAFLEPCFAGRGGAVAVRDVARSPGAALSLVAVAAGFVRKRVLKLSHEPELAAGRHRGGSGGSARPPPANGDDADRLAAQRFRLVLCQELSGGLGLVPGDPARDDDDAARPRASRRRRALKRALGLLDAPGLLSFVEKVLSRPCPTRVRDATTRALDERLDRERPLFRAREPGGPPAATPFARVLLEETLPSLARAVSGDVEHPLEDTADARHASLVAAKMADVLARALAESCRGDDGARFEVLVEAACRGSCASPWTRRPPATTAGALRAGGGAAAARDEPEADPRAALRAAEAEAGRKIADALARGVEPRVLLPAVVAARRRAAAGRAAAAAALRVALPCVARMGRGAAKAHAATVASSRSAPSTTARRRRRPGRRAPPRRASLALLSKLGDAELVDWLRAAAAWAAAAPDAAAPAAVLRPAPATDDEAAARRSAFYYQVATLATRFREIAAPRCLDACYDQCVRDMACPAEARAGKKKRKRADAVAAARRLLSYRALGCVAAVVGHLGERLAGDRFDAALEPLSAALTYDAAVWAAPAFAAFVAAPRRLRPRRSATPSATRAAPRPRAPPHAPRARRRRAHAARAASRGRSRTARTPRTSRTSSSRASRSASTTRSARRTRARSSSSSSPTRIRLV
ncbi:hypothetical protein JL722_9473 [Aureococcus anophagefferens]|nr:hypothetical protein JL722_9473 [Aureococcus anophagefferens]